MAGAYSFVVTFVILKLVDLVIGLRVSTDEEEIGLDLTQHGERGYIMGVGELMVGGVSHSERERMFSSPASEREQAFHDVNR